MLTFLGCVKAGIIAVPVFPPNPLRRDTLNMFCQIVNSCGATTALTNMEYNHAKTIGSIKSKLTSWKTNNSNTAGWPENLTWLVVDDAKHAGGLSSVQIPKQPTDGGSQIAFLQYTSGSTSAPKGVMITHDNLAHNLTTITSELKAVEDTVVVSWLPQYHDMGLIGSYLGALYCGGSGYYLSPISFLQRPMIWIEAVSKYQATHLQAPNFAFKLTARKFEASSYSKETLKLGSVRHIINAAEPVDKASLTTFYDTFGQYGLQKVIYPTYGLAEHTVFVCSGGRRIISVDKEALEKDGEVKVVDNSNGSDQASSRLVGCGSPPDSIKLRIVNAESQQGLKADRVGEIWVSSPSKAAGYYRKPEDSVSDFNAQIEGESCDAGYLRTGDLGFLHQGELFICGRLKDLIIVGGRNYYPQDIEGTAEGTSNLVRLGCSAAFTIDSTKEGNEEVALIMELKEGKTPINECVELVKQIRSSVTQEHSLSLVEIVLLEPRTVPKTSSGKIARSWCRKAYVGKTLKVVYRHAFKSTDGAEPLEVEPTTAASTPDPSSVPLNADAIRALSRAELKSKLVADVSRVANIPPGNVETDSPLVGMMDSLTLSQFKGLFERNYAITTPLSEEYLFREGTNVAKLAEVAKLGYAPDDGETGAAAAAAAVPSGTAGGLAGALGCPPGVVCAIL